MATYILLASFTDQGIRKVKDSPKRAEAFKGMAKKCGANVKDVFWTLGAYDIVAVVEAPDDTSITALGLSTGALGNVRTQTLRALARWPKLPSPILVRLPFHRRSAGPERTRNMCHS
jgi:uncharacterized protein with GYD domain